MMELTATIKSAAAVVASLGTIGSGALYMDHLHAPREQVMRMEAAGRVNTILELVDQAHREGPAEWICKTIEGEFVALCTQIPDHYWCKEPDAKRELMAKAGCQ